MTTLNSAPARLVAEGAVTRTTLRTRRPKPEDLDLLLEEISPGMAVFSTLNRPTATDGSPLLSGHPCTALVEFALAAAVQSKVPRDVRFTVAEFAVTFDETAASGRARLRATAHARAVSRDQVLAQATVASASGNVIARASLLAQVQQ